MTDDDRRSAEAKQFQQIHEAFRSGNLDGLRGAVDDPSVVPNGRVSNTIGSCLVYAIYHSPLAFIRTLLEIGADPNLPADDGFPPLIAALTCTRDEAGAPRRTDVDEILHVLLSFGADPNQRGINDYTPLHMAVAERNDRAIQILLQAGANPDLPTRIDEHETPIQMARSASLTEIAERLERRGRPLSRRLRSGLVLVDDVEGTGEPVRRQHNYRIRLRLWLNNGDAVRWRTAWGPVGVAALEANGETLITEVRIDRRSLVNGLFYGVEGMRVGGVRRLEIAPHLAYGARGVPEVIPPNAVLVAEIAILEPRPIR